jgi:hypothetical protein
MARIRTYHRFHPNIWRRESILIRLTFHDILTTSHLYAEVFVDLLHSAMYLIGINLTGIPGAWDTVVEGYPGICSRDRKERGALHSI